MKHTLSIALVLLTALVVGCGKSARNMTMREMRALPKEERAEILKEWTTEEAGWLMRASLKYAKDTNALMDKTLGELMDEGRSMPSKP